MGVPLPAVSLDGGNDAPSNRKACQGVDVSEHIKLDEIVITVPEKPQGIIQLVVVSQQGHEFMVIKSIPCIILLENCSNIFNIIAWLGGVIGFVGLHVFFYGILRIHQRGAIEFPEFLDSQYERPRFCGIFGGDLPRDIGWGIGNGVVKDGHFQSSGLVGIPIL